jgi:hypothetical protein
MKCAYTHGSTTLQDEATIAFFFNARGGELERSTAGLYRSLINQLLDKLLSRIPNLSSTLLAQPSRRRCLNRQDWPIQLLKDIFSDIVLALDSIKLTCYIDALDECSETSIRDLLDFLEDLGASTLRADIVFSIMLSSRHYPHITVRHASELILESLTGHRRDINEYVHDKLRIDDPRLARDLALDIGSRSSGVFLWVVLVVAILNQKHDRGHRHLLAFATSLMSSILCSSRSSMETRATEPVRSSFSCGYYTQIDHSSRTSAIMLLLSDSKDILSKAGTHRRRVSMI